MSSNSAVAIMTSPMALHLMIKMRRTVGSAGRSARTNIIEFRL